jgi:hypothetical protein
MGPGIPGIPTDPHHGASIAPSVAGPEGASWRPVARVGICDETESGPLQA